MSPYVLRRGRDYVCAPARHNPDALFVKGLRISSDAERAWLSADLDQAHERQTLLRYALGWATEIQAVR